MFVYLKSVADILHFKVIDPSNSSSPHHNFESNLQRDLFPIQIHRVNKPLTGQEPTDNRHPAKMYLSDTSRQHIRNC